VTQKALDCRETPGLTSCSSGSLSLQNDLLEIAMTHLSSKPVRSAQVRELTFEELLDSDEAAALLKIHPKTLQKMARNGEITGVQVGKLWRFRASVLNEWLEHKMAS
jgi:excisionase family DNA binding protein